MCPPVRLPDARLQIAQGAMVAVSEQGRVVSITLTVVPDSEQPVDEPALKLTAPPPLPPEAVAVPVVPNVILLGPLTVSAA